ncbi:TetR/AcrR family transcriptional regulator [Companilactobacillus allii]|uniref:TetR family transcriptional regulator n=1 Tax=Companilactobacillus allii TaxID=1847728 RepID=A0A1P8Q0U0_9LACO|nr:TetR/AcrR family transcriptional regulator [Companilactobacillus allii]APX71441.1 TetR family transcriptional regulator [Companilactobacillus allii]USQ68522.1 TetR/AcrR family transcriptional regulator [Companilactobacillus allii]
MAATKHAQLIKQDSKEYLVTALLQLLKHNDLNQITVSQVVKKAGVSRMAFYRNFDTLDDLLISYFEPLITAQFDEVKEKSSKEDKLSKVGEFFVRYADVLKLSIDRGFEYIIQNIFDDNMLEFYEGLKLPVEITATQHKYWVSFMSAGVYSIWRVWLINGEVESLSSMHDLIAKFQNSTMSSLVN